MALRGPLPIAEEGRNAGLRHLAEAQQQDQALQAAAIRNQLRMRVGGDLEPVDVKVSGRPFEWCVIQHDGIMAPTLSGDDSDARAVDGVVPIEIALLRVRFLSAVRGQRTARRLT